MEVVLAPVTSAGEVFAHITCGHERQIGMRELAQIQPLDEGGLMIAVRPAFWRNDAKRNLVRNQRRRAAYRDDGRPRATTPRRATTNTIQSAFDRTAARDTAANICAAVSGNAR